jgi:hypothetical protein
MHSCRWRLQRLWDQSVLQLLLLSLLSLDLQASLVLSEVHAKISHSSLSLLALNEVVICFHKWEDLSRSESVVRKVAECTI